MIKKSQIKNFFGDLPFTAEIYWQLRNDGRPISRNYSMRRTRKCLPLWLSQVTESSQKIKHSNPKNILIFTTLRYWIEHATLLGIAMAGLGHRVSLAFMPYANWHANLNQFDVRRNNSYIKSILKPAFPYLNPFSLLDIQAERVALPQVVNAAVEEISTRDVQYTEQIERVDPSSQLYLLRKERNTRAAKAALHTMQVNRPDILLTPNGSILEMGSVFQVARYLNIPTVTYEFGEQRDRIWLAQNSEVMLQETGDMWSTRGGSPLTQEQSEKIRTLYDSRQGAKLWKNFTRQWQDSDHRGGETTRRQLGLDSRPIVLLAANVIGDSLTLGRQVFTQNMTEWLEKTVRDMEHRTDAQLVVRIHPGERYTRGPSVADVIAQVMPQLPPHIHLVAADDPINTYDLIEIADVGLVYTTTVGMEMAMSGVPVIVIGNTHYRSKGFTFDPHSWEEYSRLLEQALDRDKGLVLGESQVELAWNYAYNFFFEYPCPFPWHLLYFWDELEEWPLSKVLSDEGRERYGATFSILAGEPRDWTSSIADNLAEPATEPEFDKLMSGS